MNQKVGIADSGMASAEMIVARQSRRNRNTTMTARIAPSIIAWIALSYWSIVYLTLSERRTNCTFGLRFISAASLTFAPSNTVTSDAPLARWKSKLMTCLPLIADAERCSAYRSRTCAMSASRTVRPFAEIWVWPRSNALLALPSTRTDCSDPAISARPPAAFRLIWRSCALTWDAVSPCD